MIATKIIVVSVVGCFVILAQESDSLNFGMGCRAYLSVWWEERAFCVKHVALQIASVLGEMEFTPFFNLL